MRSWRWMLVGSSVVLPALAADPGDAGEHGATQLRWVRDAAAEGCISEMELRHAVQRRLSRDPFAGTPNQWLEGVVSREQESWSARIFERDASGRTLGTRSLRDAGASCRGLDAGIVLAVTLLIDPDAVLTETEVGTVSGATATSDPASAGVAFPAEAPTPPVVAAEPPVAQLLGPTPAATDAPRRGSGGKANGSTPGAQAARPSPGVEAMASGLLTSGWLPNPAPGAEVGAITWFGRRFGLELSALHLLEQRTSGAADIGLTLTAFSVAGCARTDRSEARWTGTGCLGASVGGITAVVYDPRPTGPGERFWGAIRAEAGVELSLLGPLRAHASGLLAVPSPRWGFKVQGDENPAFRQSFVLSAGELGIVLSFR
ncbi:MAG: hypothetical protein JW751_12435 [Polyangiaceae bacterium]|nr:hypothetical protein [Polyangiaceae bacterium]